MRMPRDLQTARLRLEPLQVAHAEAMFELLSDPAIYEYENAPPASLQALRERYARQTVGHSPDGREQWLNWVLRLRADGRLIGYVQASVMPAQGRALIGYELASDFWGQGLAREAVQAMLDELALNYGVRRCAALLKRANGRSQRLLMRLGFKRASARRQRRRRVARDEWLMERELSRSDPAHAHPRPS